MIRSLLRFWPVAVVSFVLGFLVYDLVPRKAEAQAGSFYKPKAGCVAGVNCSALSFTGSAASGADAFIASQGARIKVGSATFTYDGTTWTSATGFSSTVASGSNAFGVGVNGGRIDVGAGANDYFDSNGSRISTYVDLRTTGNIDAVNAIFYGTITNSNPSTPVTIDDVDGSRQVPKTTLLTCASGTVGARQIIAAVASTTHQKECVCMLTSAGAYRYINLYKPTDTGGTTTTCPDT